MAVLGAVADAGEMIPEHPEFLPDPNASHAVMEAQQRTLAETAVFEDGDVPSPQAVALSETPALADRKTPGLESPIVVGVDQAFLEDFAVSAAVAIQDGAVIEVSCGKTPLSIPYIPGLLAFREGEPIIDALESLSETPDLLVLDGNGRIHYREAGIATHVGVLYDVPAVGVAKNLLCGSPVRSLEEPLSEGAQIPIYADAEVEAEEDTLIGYAFQSRQFPNPERRHVNPIFVSPGHKVATETAVELISALGTGYKLPAPIRVADRAAEDCKD